MSQKFRTAFRGFHREDVVNYLEYANKQHTLRINQLSEEAANLRDRLQDSIANAEELSVLKEDFAAQQEMLDSAQAENQQLQAALEAKEKDSAARQEKLDSVQAENQRLQAALDAKEKEKAALQEKLDSLNEENARIRGQYDSACRRISELETVSADTIAALRQEAEKLRMENDQLWHRTSAPAEPRRFESIQSRFDSLVQKKSDSEKASNQAELMHLMADLRRVLNRME